MSETHIVNTSASAGSIEKVLVQKMPRPFPIRLGVGLGKTLKDGHLGLNEFLWDVDRRGDAPVGVILGLFGNLVTGVGVLMGCGVLALMLAHPFSYFLISLPSLFFALMPAEIVAVNIVINIVTHIPKIIKTIGQGLFNIVKFAAAEIAKRIPDE